MNEPQSIIVLALRQFDGGPLWWIGVYVTGDGEELVHLEDCDSNEDFAEQFVATQCIETHPPLEIESAIRRAREIAKERSLQLYRATCYTENRGQFEVFETA